MSNIYTYKPEWEFTDYFDVAEKPSEYFSVEEEGLWYGKGDFKKIDFYKWEDIGRAKPFTRPLDESFQAYLRLFDFNGNKLLEIHSETGNFNELVNVICQKIATTHKKTLKISSFKNTKLNESLIFNYFTILFFIISLSIYYLTGSIIISSIPFTIFFILFLVISSRIRRVYVSNDKICFFSLIEKKFIPCLQSRI